MTQTGHIVVVGATGGIGQALCQQLSAGPTRLSLLARDAAQLNELSSRLGMPAYPVDVTVPGSVEAAFEALTANAPPVTGVAYCVGSIFLKPAHLTRDADWETTLALNLTGAFRVLRAAVQAMPQKGEGGSIVMVSSVAGQLGLANHEAIAAAKAGVEGLVRAAAATYAPRNLRVNAVAPGLVETPLSASLLSTEAGRSASMKMHPLGRLGRPEDVASAIAWLLDPGQHWVTGQVIGVDGGMSRLRPR